MIPLLAFAALSSMMCSLGGMSLSLLISLLGSVPSAVHHELH